MPWIDPERAFAALVAIEHDVFWLDGGAHERSGWSWVGRGTPESDAGAVRAVRVGGRMHTSAAAAGVPFRGGWVGFIDYETGAARAGAAHAAEPGAGERWLRVDDLLAFDHARRLVFAIGPRADELLRAARSAPEPAAPGPAPPLTATARHTPDEYAALVAGCRAHIRDGDAYQLCLTTRFVLEGSPDPVAAYRRLRRRAGTRHGGFQRIGDAALVSATPERFLSLADGVVRTHPIKGTRPRSADPVVDAALADELRADVKERAENVMIVDLMRNDLSRVCRPSTVGVDRLLEVESYPTVHQLVSSVSGELRAEATLGEVLDATFPAGSMTGAPKLSAMDILHELEGAPRGVFAGCAGWVGDDGRVELSMVIRSIVVTPALSYVGAGGGITWRSVTAAEVAEVGLKAAAPLAAVGARVPPGW